MEKIIIPRYVDDPPQILFFSLDEFVLIMLFAVLGELWGMLFPGILLGVGIARIFKKLQEGAMPGLLYHMLFWIGIVTFKSYVPTGLIREIYE